MIVAGRLSAGVGYGDLTPYLLATGGDIFVAPALGGPAAKLVEVFGREWCEALARAVLEEAS